MQAVFADTFYWIALTNTDDLIHHQALSLSRTLTDCTSMEVMTRQGLTDVLTNDRHFEHEGFRALFRA